MKLALLLPGYIDSPDYTHLITFEKGLQELGYAVERLDLGNLWTTGDPKNYNLTYFLQQIRERIEHYLPQNPEEILLLGHSRGGTTAIIAGSRIPEVTRVIALCPPPDVLLSAKKWPNQGVRTSKKDLPHAPSEYREFSIPYAYIEDFLQYSAIQEVQHLHKPLMILIALNDTVVPPELTEQIVAKAHNPYVVRMPDLDHDFRFFPEKCAWVMDEVKRYLAATAK